MNKYKKGYFDIVIIGGGFYGCMIALALSNSSRKILILEKESDILKRASYNNQARVHNGYHYPRSFLTAIRSHANSLKFIKDFKKAICDNYSMIYAIASTFSKTTSMQFKKFCKQIGSPIYSLSPQQMKIFDEFLIEDAFLVEEHIFDAGILRKLIKELLTKGNVVIMNNATVNKIDKTKNCGLVISLEKGGEIIANSVFNCTYSQINNILKNSNLPTLPLKHEFTEMPLIDVPPQLKGFGITIMDGPFWGALPFPDKKLHTIHHVRYTPRISWIDDGDKRKKINFDKLKKESNYPFIIKDAQRYVPLIKQSKYKGSMYEIRTVLPQMEDSDGRPILYRNNYGFDNFHIVLGGKIDNVYDIINEIKNPTI